MVFGPPGAGKGSQAPRVPPSPCPAAALPPPSVSSHTPEAFLFLRVKRVFLSRASRRV